VPSPISRPEHLSIHVYGHESSEPESVAEALGAHFSQTLHTDSDLAIFVIDPNTGVDAETISKWSALDDFQTPRLVVVTHLQNQEADFDDGVALANRLFDSMLTPFLVLHDEDGLPVALISLENMTITDYSTNPPTLRASEEEHQTLVQEFRDEYLSVMEVMNDGAFAAGLLFPAIPLWLERGIGVDIVNNYIEQIKK